MPRGDGRKKAFILAQPASMPSAELIRLAAADGLKIGVSTIYNTRRHAPPPPAPPPDRDADMRAAFIRMGHARAIELMNEVFGPYGLRVA